MQGQGDFVSKLKVGTGVIMGLQELLTILTMPPLPSK